MEFKTIKVSSATGAAVQSAGVSVYQRNTTTPVLVYDESGVLISGGLATDTDGNVAFAAANGTYDVVAEISGLSSTIENVTFFDINDAIGTTVQAWDAALSAAFDTLAAFVAWAGGVTVDDGVVIAAGPVQFQADSTATVSGLPAGWVPFGDVTPDHFADNTTPGNTNMRDAIVSAWLYSDDVHLLDQRYRVSGATVTVDDGKKLTGKGWSTGYGGGTTKGSIIVEDKVTSGDVIQIAGTSSAFADRARTMFKDVAFTSASTKITTNLTGVVVNLISLKNTFLNVFDNCLFTDLNVHAVLTGDATGSQNAVVFKGGQITSIGDARDGFELITGRYTYGTGLDLSLIPDSEILGTFIEFCGRYGARLGGNSRAIGVFNDLCWRGYEITKVRAQVIGGGCKWHQQNGLYFNVDAKDWTVSGVTVIGNNYASATGTGENFALRLTSGNTGWLVTDVFAVDALQVNKADKTELQNFIHFGSAGNNGAIDGIRIGDTATSGNNFHDPNGNLSTGGVSVKNVSVIAATASSLALESAGAVMDVSALTHTPTALIGGAEAILSGSVQARDATTLYASERTSIGPHFSATTIPATAITDKTGGANTGAISVSGFSYLAPFVHTGGGGAETNIVAPVPTKFLGHIEIAFGDGGTSSFFYAAHVKYDAGAVTVLDEIFTISSIGALSLSVSGGNLLLSSTTSTAQSGDMIVKFTGTWMQAA